MTYAGGKEVDTESVVARRGDFAHAIAAADAVRIVHDADRPCCILCWRESDPGLVAMLSPATGSPESHGQERTYVMVCRRCRAAASEDTESAVVELARAGRVVDELLSLVRHRADQQLGGWWGGVGACTREDVDAASVALRRSLERLKPMLPGVS